MSESLAVKWRPNDWEQVCGQKSVISILSRQLDTGNVRNAYLFSGASGCGKTTIARIFANKINQGIGEPIEIDAASNNGVDNVKSIIKQAQERALDGKYKIFIIDECHMITTQGWNAFLKCIEEPPRYTIFLFCTTDPQKIPNTILNRVQRHNITKLKTDLIQKRLDEICKNENFINYQEATEYIAKTCDGGMRDAIATLEKCSNFSNDLNIDNVMEALGSFSYQTFFDLINAMIDGDEAAVLNTLYYLHSQGNDLKLFVDMFLDFCLDIAKYTIFKDTQITKIPGSMESRIKNSCNFDNALSYYMYVVNQLLELKNLIKNDSNIRTTIEIIFLKVTRMQ